jgi:uncharacterized membrane protein YgcG
MNLRPSRPRVAPLARVASFLGFAAVAGVGGLLCGCGAEDEQQEARYPQGGTGAEPARQTSASLEAIPPADPTEIAIGVEGEDDGYAESDPSALTTFKPALDNYGTWEDDGTYGTVWYPSRAVVGNEFAPYVSAGHWVYDDDYVWVSDYDWGWAPFHYGRWVNVAGRGWAWIPGRRYAGAWVTWRTGYDGYGYVGWAPLPPTWYWRGGYAYGLYAVPPAPYVFCASHDVFAPAVGQRVVVGSQVAIVAANTRPYVPATPGVGGVVSGGRVPANPGVSGPPPGRLGLNAGSVPHAPHGHVGLLRAQQQSHPSGNGGRAPIANGTRTLGSGAATGTVYSGAPTRIDRPERLPSQGISGGSQAGTPPTFSSSYPPSAGRSSPTYGASPSGPSSGPTFHSSPAYSGSSGAPSYSGSSGSPSYSGSPSFRGGAPSGGGASPSGGGASPSGGGAMRSAPAAAAKPNSHTGAAPHRR